MQLTDKELLRGFKASVSRQVTGHGDSEQVVHVGTEYASAWNPENRPDEVAAALQRVVERFLAGDDETGDSITITTADLRPDKDGAPSISHTLTPRRHER